LRIQCHNFQIATDSESWRGRQRYRMLKPIVVSFGLDSVYLTVFWTPVTRSGSDFTDDYIGFIIIELFGGCQPVHSPLSGGMTGQLSVFDVVVYVPLKYWLCFLYEEWLLSTNWKQTPAGNIRRESQWIKRAWNDILPNLSSWGFKNCRVSDNMNINRRWVGRSWRKFSSSDDSVGSDFTSHWYVCDILLRCYSNINFRVCWITEY
jgi:hypothetical protein